jgi:hypothetical protein
MLEALTDLPEGVIGFEAVGEVTSADYEQTLDPAIDAIDGPVRFVYVLGERFDGYTAGAAWQDAKTGVEKMRKLHRVAVVTDTDWVRHALGMFGWMMPGKFELFGLDHRSDAIAWAAAD